MNGEYHTLNNHSIETKVLFFGQENCLPNYFFKGNNVRNNYVIHYIQSGKGTFSVANHHAVNLKAGDIFLLPKDIADRYRSKILLEYAQPCLEHKLARIQGNNLQNYRPPPVAPEILDVRLFQMA